MFHGAVALAGESICQQEVYAALCHTALAPVHRAAGVQHYCCSKLAVEVCSAPNKFSLAGFLTPLQKPMASWKYPRKHLSRPSQKLGITIHCVQFLDIIRKLEVPKGFLKAEASCK